MSNPVEVVATPVDCWPGLLEHYRQTAVLVLVSHQCADNVCTSCGQAWPCRPACAAEIALEL
jgi:hypothetical protein